MTVSQRRAIGAITQRLEVDADQEARHLFGVRVDDLSIRQAGKLTDHLKAIAPARNGRHR